jgi:hypothetical protein
VCIYVTHVQVVVTPENTCVELATTCGHIYGLIGRLYAGTHVELCIAKTCARHAYLILAPAKVLMFWVSGKVYLLELGTGRDER